MNRYQRQVAEMDRRQQLKVRVFTFTGAAALIVAALWSAGLPPTRWLERVSQFFVDMGSEVSSPLVPPQSSSLQQAAPIEPDVAHADATMGADASMSATPQPLHLVSTAPGRNSREGTAALGVDWKNPQIYAAGALLVNGARLSEIHADFVVLEKAGASMRLYRQGDRRQASEQNNALLLVGGVPSGAAPAVNLREVVTDYLRPSPVYDGGVLRGYVVYPGARSGVFSQLGLQAGDVITALNEVPLSDPSQAYAVLRQLVDGVAMTATVSRKGEVQRLTLDGAVVLADQERVMKASASVSEPPALPPG